jgi:transcriptional regulator with XRE-family HTH domain
MNVGSLLKQLRQARGISQRALAKSVGVSNGTISLIEKGETDPSVGLLKKILDGLSVSMADFFAGDFEPRNPYFFTSDQMVEIGSGTISYKQIAHDLTGSNLQIIHECYQPGADTGPSMLSHEGEEGGIIISGHLEISVADQSRTLGPGEAYQFPSTLPHRFRNQGNEACVVVSACTPPSF